MKIKFHKPHISNPHLALFKTYELQFLLASFTSTLLRETWLPQSYINIKYFLYTLALLSHNIYGCRVRILN